MLEIVLNAIRKHEMIAEGDRVIAAVSGGPDSVFMLDALDKLKGQLGFSLEVAHFEHGIRGEASKLDAQFVRELAGKRGLVFHFEEGDAVRAAKDGKMSVEEAARELRYSFFEKIAVSGGANLKIATGHTATDQAETVLMRLLRGAGLRGLAGIPPVRGFYIRPIIDTGKSDILKYLREQEIDFREDESNEATRYLRNKIRKELMPLLEETYNPRIVETLVKTANACRASSEFFDSFGESAMQKYAENGEDGLFIPAAAFRNGNEAAMNAVFEAAYKKFNGDLLKLDFDHRANVIEAIEKGRSGLFSLPGDLFASVDSTGLLIADSPPVSDIKYKTTLKLPGITVIPEIDASIDAKIIKRPSDGEPWKKNSADEAWFDFDKTGDKIEVRNFERGDKIKPLGMSGVKKLHDIFIDMKIPRRLRLLYPVLTSGDRVIWLASLKISEDFKIDSTTKNIVVLRLTESPQTR